MNTNKKAHYLQHVPFEDLGNIKPWLEFAGFSITCTKLYQKNATLPNIKDIDLLIIIGGPMSVNNEKEYPFLLDEKKLIKSVIDAGIATLGICLGAQLIASVMGAKVFKNAVKELGWFPITAVNTPRQNTFQFPANTYVFHWHDETFDLPPTAVRIAESKGCKNQAFQIGNNVIGLQFHLETTPKIALEIVQHCRDELAIGKYIQNENDILATQEHYAPINTLMIEVLTYLCDSTKHQ